MSTPKTVFALPRAFLRHILFVVKTILEPSGFTIGTTGALTPIAGTVVGINPPGSGNLDIAVSSDSKFVYSINSAAGSIGSFAIQSDGSLLLVNEIGGLPAAVGFNGIAAL